MAQTLLALRAQLSPAVISVGHSTSGGWYLADTGFEGRARHAAWQQAFAAHVITPPKRVQQADRWPKPLRRWLASWRQIVERVHADLLIPFRLDRERPH